MQVLAVRHREPHDQVVHDARVERVAVEGDFEFDGLVLVIDHVWATGLRDAVMDAGGVTAARQPIDAAALVAVGLTLDRALGRRQPTSLTPNR
jgi:hypothetical protein